MEDLNKKNIVFLSDIEITELLSKKGNYIQYLKNPTMEQMLIAVKQNGYAIRHIPNPAEMVVWEAIKKQPTAIQFVKSPTKEQIEYCFEKSAEVIAFIENPTYEQMLSAVSRKGGTIQYIKNPTSELVNIALKNNPMSLSYIYKIVSKDLMRKIIKSKPKAIRNVLNKVTKEIQLFTIQQRGMYLKYITNQTEELCIEAIKNNPLSISYVKTQTLDIKKEVIESKNKEAIKQLIFDNEEISIYLIERFPEMIYLIKDPSEQLLNLYNRRLLEKDKKIKKEFHKNKISPKDLFLWEKMINEKIGKLEKYFSLVLDNKVPINHIINYLVENIDIEEVDIATGFAFKSGFGKINNLLKMMHQKQIKARLIIGSLQKYNKCIDKGLYVTDMDIETAKYLNLLTKNNLIELYTHEQCFYHGKYYYFKGKEISVIIIGSSNLSGSGLEVNRECNILYVLKNGYQKNKIQWFEDFILDCEKINLLDERCFVDEKNFKDSLESKEQINVVDFSNRIKSLTDIEKRERLNIWINLNPNKIYEVNEIQAFTNYYIFIYEEYNVCVLESIVKDNAFYCFNTSNYHQLIKYTVGLSKIKIMQCPLFIKRGYHTKDLFNTKLVANGMFYDFKNNK